MQNKTQITTEPPITDRNRETVAPTGGLSVRTDLRAGLAWDDLDDHAKSIWSNLTSTVSGLKGGADAS